MITAYFKPAAEVVANNLRARGPRAIKSITRELTKQLIKLQSYVVTNKLSGDPLKRGPNRPGHSGGELARSIRVVEPIYVGTILAGQVLGAGGTAWYGRLHEYGGTFIAARTRLIRPPHLVTRSGGERVMTGSPYAIHFPMRSFMRTSLREMRESIVEALRNAGTKGMNEK